ncbi:putative nuclease HARBI1 [Thrips palmi]|uniref:Nuclease HARBI1 n=1 Tax=Thrips palmi TaxID=161013 RepID=A0A6P8Y0L9_THRPL|nr:putative nuclease HARBI1 [Thrips palmi]
MEEHDAERRRQINGLILRRRRIRDFGDPFDVTHEAFVGSYRLSQDLVRSLLDLIRPHVRQTTSPLAVSLEIKVLCVLQFFATGCYQKPTGKSMDAAVAQSTVSGYLSEITTALNNPLVVARIIQFPRNLQQMRACVARNRHLGGRLPNVVSYTDGTLIKIMKPTLDDNILAYIGRKSYASLNVLVTCDKRLYITNIIARFPGATNDSFIFANSALKRKMIEFNEDEPCFLLGDSGFAQEPWMLTPFDGDDEPQPDTPEMRYNKDFCQERCTVERCIGVMKERYRAINDERVLHYRPHKACQIIVAIAVLHNLCILAQVPYYRENEDMARNLNFNDWREDAEDIGPNEDYGNEDHILIAGLNVRRQVVDYLEETRN